MSIPYQVVADCRICGGRELHPVISLGAQPLANNLPTAETPGPDATLPLAVVRCGRCSLVQLTVTVDRETLFGDYLYCSSQSETMVEHARAMAEAIRREHALGPAGLVVEIGSNDGYLLRHLVAAGVPALGIEPARAIAAAAQAAGVPTRTAFFDLALAQALVHEGRRADVIIANNVLAHAADLQGLVAGIAALLKPEGRAVFEFPYLFDLLDSGAFDTIYHEHLCYFSATAVAELLSRHDLVIERIERQAIHGGSLRVQAARHAELAASLGVRKGTHPPAVQAWLDQETARGVRQAEPYAAFAARVQGVLAGLRALLAELRRDGRRLAGYAAAAKCTVLLNALGPDAADWLCVADANARKQDRRVPGTAVPIVSPQALLAARPDVVCIFAWNIAAEVMRVLDGFKRTGGKFLLPLPEPRLI